MSGELSCGREDSGVNGTGPGTDYPDRETGSLERWSSSGSSRRRPCSLDVVIPVYNEGAVLEALFERLQSVFAGENLEKHGISLIRFIFVDDGSTDESVSRIISHISSGFPAEVYLLSRNFGHQCALAAGIDMADADLVAVMDADLQDPPELIARMIGKWRQGYDVVYARRRKRKENPIKVACYWLFYRIVSLLSEVEIPVDSGDFCVMDRRVVEAIRAMPEKLRFQRGARAWVGFRQTGVQYDRPARMAGETKYSLRKLYRLATDGLAWLTVWPLKLAQFATAMFALLTMFLVGVWLTRLLRGSPMNEPVFWFMVTLIVVSAGFCVVSVCLYAMSAYIARTYIEAKNRPSYVIMNHIDAQTLTHSPRVPTEQDSEP